MTKKIKLSEISNLFGDIESLEGVNIEGDIEIDLSNIGISREMAYALGYETAQIAAHLINISRILGYPVDQLQPQQPKPKKPKELIETKFEVGKIEEWKTPIQEVVLGATSSDGGSRGKTITIGGEKALPYYFDADMPHRNYVTMDVFDMPIGMAKTVKSNYEDVIESPSEWAKKS